MSDHRRTIHRRFGPNVIEVAKFLTGEIGGDVIPLLEAIDQRWPGLTARDLRGAFVLAEALALEPRGRA